MSPEQKSVPKPPKRGSVNNSSNPNASILAHPIGSRLPEEKVYRVRACEKGGRGVSGWKVDMCKQHTHVHTECSCHSKGQKGGAARTTSQWQTSANFVGGTGISGVWIGHEGRYETKKLNNFLVPKLRSGERISGKHFIFV